MRLRIERFGVSLKDAESCLDEIRKRLGNAGEVLEDADLPTAAMQTVLARFL